MRSSVVLTLALTSAFTFAFIGPLAACSSDGEAPDARSPFSVWVLDAPLALGDAPSPLVDVEVVFDPADGSTPTTTRTDAEGHAILQADFTKGEGSVTVVSPGHVYVTVLGASPTSAKRRGNAIGKPDADLVVFPARLDDGVTSETVGVTGTITGKKDTFSKVDVSVSHLSRLGSSTAPNDFTLRAPRGRPLFLLAHEITNLPPEGARSTNQIQGSYRVALPELTADTVFNLDFSALAPLPFHVVELHAQRPTDGGSPFTEASTIAANVLSAESDLLIGPRLSTAPSTDGRGFDVALQVVDTDIAPEHVITSVTLGAPDGSHSERIELGVSADGTVFSDFLLPPTIRAPEVSRSLKEPLTIDGIPAGADIRVELVAGRALGWVIEGLTAAAETTTLRFPAHAASLFPVDVQLFGVTVSASADPVALSPYRTIHRRSATSREISVRKL